MNESEKKISFSFTKAKKPRLSSQVNKVSVEKVEYIDSFSSTENVSPKEPPKLVIPMMKGNTFLLSIKKKIDEKKNLKKNEQKSQDVDNNDKNCHDSQPDSISNAEQSLDKLAMAEILNDIKGDTTKEISSKLIISCDDLSNADQEIPIDYEKVPVSEFGMAMLRGMGWKPDPQEAIAQNPKKKEFLPVAYDNEGLGYRGYKMNGKRKPS